MWDLDLLGTSSINDRQTNLEGKRTYGRCKQRSPLQAVEAAAEILLATECIRRLIT